MRKPRFLRGAALVGAAALLLAGCSTPGPLHLYSVNDKALEIGDVPLDPEDSAHPTPSFLGAEDRLLGFAYDPFTDHFFLRLAPGNVIRVVDRPARKIKREFTIDGIPPLVGTDLAVSPRDGHLFLVDASDPALVETSRLGERIRLVHLDGRSTPAKALAFDMERSRLIALGADGRTLDFYNRDGLRLTQATLAKAVEPSLAYDATSRELYAPLRDAPTSVGVFSETGVLLRTIPVRGGASFLDVGPHSFLRVF
jgi:hypothetical protein